MSDVKLPRQGTMVREFLDFWQARPMKSVRFMDGVYFWQNMQVARYGGKPSAARHVSQNMLRILRKYGAKIGKNGDRTPWVFGRKELPVLGKLDFTNDYVQCAEETEENEQTDCEQCVAEGKTTCVLDETFGDEEKLTTDDNDWNQWCDWKETECGPEPEEENFFSDMDRANEKYRAKHVTACGHCALDGKTSCDLVELPSDEEYKIKDLNIKIKEHDLAVAEFRAYLLAYCSTPEAWRKALKIDVMADFDKFFPYKPKGE